jgi:hypothetical protein
MDALVLDIPAERLGWLLAAMVAGLFLLIVAVVAFWMSR